MSETSWRKQAVKDPNEDDGKLMLQQFVFYMEELVKLLREPSPKIAEIADWLDHELKTAKQEMEW